MSDESTTFDIKGLDQLSKALKENLARVRVGILGGKNARNPVEGEEKSTASNAEIGAAHEFGTSTLPQRSFLRVPISEHLDKELDNSGLLDKNSLDEVIKKGSVTPWLKKIAIVAEGIVAEAFASGGYGKWPAWKTKNYTNNTGDILVDTQQLRNSITSDVEE